MSNTFALSKATRAKSEVVGISITAVTSIEDAKRILRKLKNATVDLADAVMQLASN